MQNAQVLYKFSLFTTYYFWHATTVRHSPENMASALIWRLFSPWKKKNINATHYILSTYTHAMYFFNHQRLPVGNGEEGRGGKKGSVAGRCCQVGNVNYRISRKIIIHRITGQCLRLLFPAVFFATPHLSPWTLIFPCLFFLFSFFSHFLSSLAVASNWAGAADHSANHARCSETRTWTSLVTHI